MTKDNIITSDVYHLIKVLNGMLKKAGFTQSVSVEAALYYKEEDGNLRIEFKYLFHGEKMPPEIVFKKIVEVDPYEFFNKNTTTRAEINESFFESILKHSNFTY